MSQPELISAAPSSSRLLGRRRRSRDRKSVSYSRRGGIGLGANSADHSIAAALSIPAETAGPCHARYLPRAGSALPCAQQRAFVRTTDRIEASYIETHCVATAVDACLQYIDGNNPVLRSNCRSNIATRIRSGIWHLTMQADPAIATLSG
jgi:hypothetical protein